MKLLKTMTVGLLAAALPGLASAAPTVLHIAGSTAYRSCVDSALVNYLNANGGCKAAYNHGSNIVKNNVGIYANGTLGTTGAGAATIVVVTNWTGSLAGVVDLTTQNRNLAFLDPNNATVQAAVNNDVVTVTSTSITDVSSQAIASNNAAGLTANSAPDVAMSDSFQSSVAASLSTANLTAQPGSVTVSPLSGAGLAALVKAAPLAEAGTGSSSAVVSPGTGTGYLGIVPFEWVLGNITGASNETVIPFTNITLQTADFLITKGYAPFTMFGANNTAGLANDPTKFVYLVGRNEDSGTRIDAFAEPLLGFTSNPQQYLLTFAGGSTTSDVPTPTDFTQIGGATATVTKMVPWPAGATLNTESSINWSSAGGGHGGYAAGGDVSSVLSTPVDQGSLANDGSGFAAENAGNSFFIGYLGISDAGNFVTPSTSTPGGSNSPSSVTGGTSLSYNGVPYSTVNVQSGAYTFWSYEHMYYLGSGSNAITTAQKTVADTLANLISTTYANYNSSGNPGQANAAGVLLLAHNTGGAVQRSVEGGILSLNY